MPRRCTTSSPRALDAHRLDRAGRIVPQPDPLRADRSRPGLAARATTTARRWSAGSSAAAARSGPSWRPAWPCWATTGQRPTTDIQQAIATTYQRLGRQTRSRKTAPRRSCRWCAAIASYEPRIRAALDRYRAKPAGGFVRAFGGGGLPRSLPVKHWVCFFLARTLGNLADPHSVDSLLAVLRECPKEAASGRPDPSDAAVLVPAQ